MSAELESEGKLGHDKLISNLIRHLVLITGMHTVSNIKIIINIDLYRITVPYIYDAITSSIPHSWQHPAPLINPPE